MPQTDQEEGHKKKKTARKGCEATDEMRRITDPPGRYSGLMRAA
jgi:hypothetical protein